MNQEPLSRFAFSEENSSDCKAVKELLGMLRFRDLVLCKSNCNDNHLVCCSCVQVNDATPSLHCE